MGIFSYYNINLLRISNKQHIFYDTSKKKLIQRGIVIIILSSETHGLI
jgi:hypothetical protein